MVADGRASAATSRAGLAAAAGAGLGIGLLMLHTLGAQVAALRDLAWLNPWTVPLRDSPLLHAVSLTPLLVPLLVGLALTWGSLPFLNRRDVGR